jgi:cell division protein FtsQ
MRPVNADRSPLSGESAHPRRQAPRPHTSPYEAPHRQSPHQQHAYERATARLRRRRRPPVLLRPVLLLVALSSAAVALSAAAGWASQVIRLEDRIAAFKGAALAASANVGLTLQDVVVVGRRQTDRAELLTAVGLKRGDTILTFDVDEARARIEALPWIKWAQVERAFPDAIRITVTERMPLAIWQNAGRLQLIDTEGLTIRSGDLRRYRELPIVVGPDAAEQASSILATVAGYPDLAKRMTAASRIGGRRWDLRFDGRVDVRLPEEEPAAALKRFAALQRANGLLERDIVAVDMRFADRLVVELTPAAQDKLSGNSKSKEDRIKGADNSAPRPAGRDMVRDAGRETGRT